MRFSSTTCARSAKSDPLDLSLLLVNRRWCRWISREFPVSLASFGSNNTQGCYLTRARMIFQCWSYGYCFPEVTATFRSCISDLVWLAPHICSTIWAEKGTMRQVHILSFINRANNPNIYSTYCQISWICKTVWYGNKDFHAIGSISSNLILQLACVAVYIHIGGTMYHR